jgi:hypothetical protein
MHTLHTLRSTSLMAAAAAAMVAAVSHVRSLVALVRQLSLGLVGFESGGWACSVVECIAKVLLSDNEPAHSRGTTCKLRPDLLEPLVSKRCERVMSVLLVLLLLRIERMSEG